MNRKFRLPLCISGPHILDSWGATVAKIDPRIPADDRRHYLEQLAGAVNAYGPLVDFARWMKLTGDAGQRVVAMKLLKDIGEDTE